MWLIYDGYCVDNTNRMFVMFAMFVMNVLMVVRMNNKALCSVYM